MEHPMRRAERALSGEEAMLVLKEAEYGVLSVMGPDGEPYGVPLNFCLSGDGGGILFHAASEGRKAECLRTHPFAHFTVVSGVRIHSEAMTTQYRSAMAEGPVREITDMAAKCAAVCRLARRYGATGDPMPYAVRTAERYTVFELRIETLSGKHRPPMDAEAVAKAAAMKQV